jgi:uncharacterized membrane protein YgaE (UPF0421/DUF939 family)
MAAENYERQIMIWTMVGVIVAMLIQAVIFSVDYGRLEQKCDDIEEQVHRIEQFIDVQYQHEQRRR